MVEPQVAATNAELRKNQAVLEYVLTFSVRQSRQTDTCPFGMILLYVVPLSVRAIGVAYRALG